MLHIQREYPYQTQKQRQSRKKTITPRLLHFKIQIYQKIINIIECGQVIFIWSQGGVTDETVLNVMHGIRHENIKRRKVKITRVRQEHQQNWQISPSR